MSGAQHVHQTAGQVFKLVYTTRRVHGHTDRIAADARPPAGHQAAHQTRGEPESNIQVLIALRHAARVLAAAVAALHGRPGGRAAAHTRQAVQLSRTSRSTRSHQIHADCAPQSTATPCQNNVLYKAYRRLLLIEFISLLIDFKFN